ncbi:MAG: geranylgeranylglyceryl/heptaprenylglyceryl phosphate synthase [Chitinophagales bacterium]|nr:geranylgeranylglyceryl/heptaprenylglyceryl phosphate synthase [Chitinophagales bacterium]
MSYINDSIITSNVSDGKKAFAILIDPDKCSKDHLEDLLALTSDVQVEFFFVGGSLLTKDQLDKCISYLKDHSSIPVIIFPGNNMQLSSHADAILFLSLISGRNPELLIGQHVIAAPKLKEIGLPVIPTAYLLIDGGKATSVSYMSHTIPIPSDKFDIAASTALAGEMLGLKMIYMDAGSGALKPVHPRMIKMVKRFVNIPVIVGGGIKSPEEAELICKAGADVVVVGNAIEKDPKLIADLSIAIHSSQTVS